jgi:hypothetical protein
LVRELVALGSQLIEFGEYLADGWCSGRGYDVHKNK